MERLISFIGKKAENLFPGYFAMVMATGALSVAMFLQGMGSFARILVYLNAVFYALLWIFTLIRLIWFFPRVKADLTSHASGPGFFTTVAGTNVFGSQLIVVVGHYKPAFYLWLCSIVLWVLIMYTFFVSVTVREHKPTLAMGVNGAWLIASVSTQSIAVLGALLSTRIVNGQEVILFITLCMYLLGCMLYLNIIGLIFYRFTFVEFQYATLTPTYWINMGAVAIATLSGSTLILNERHWPLFVEIIPFMKGFTLFFWVTGTWWIPLLFILMIWRHLIHRYPLNYDPQFWGMAFPLAMYTTGTYQLSKALGIPFLTAIPHFMVYIAIAAWLTGFVGLIRHSYVDARKELWPSSKKRAGQN